MLELTYATIRAIQKSHAEGSPRIEALIGVCLILAPVCFAVLSIALSYFAGETRHGNLRHDPVYWLAMVLAVALAFVLFDRRLPAIDSKYADLQAPQKFVGKLPYIGFLFGTALGLAFLAARWPIACLGAFAALEITLRRSSKSKSSSDHQ